jgi:hypothetical protein
MAGRTSRLNAPARPRSWPARPAPRRRRVDCAFPWRFSPASPGALLLYPVRAPVTARRAQNDKSVHSFTPRVRARPQEPSQSGTHRGLPWIETRFALLDRAVQRPLPTIGPAAARPGQHSEQRGIPVGDGAWRTVTAIGDHQWSLADPLTGNAAVRGAGESGDRALLWCALPPLTVHVAVELLVARLSIAACLPVRTPSATELTRPSGGRARERADLSSRRLLRTLQQGGGTLTRASTRAASGENGVRRPIIRSPTWRRSPARLRGAVQLGYRSTTGSAHGVIRWWTRGRRGAGRWLHRP